MPKPRMQIKDESLTVRAALSLDAFAGARVIAGEAGLGRTISNAMVMEAADIERWGRKGIFLVTSFYALEPLSQEERSEFLRKLVEIKPAGIAFKPGRLLAEAPDDIVACCAAADIPLIRLNASTKYETVLTDVMGSALDTNLMLLKPLLQHPSPDHAARPRAAKHLRDPRRGKEDHPLRMLLLRQGDRHLRLHDTTPVKPRKPQARRAPPWPLLDLPLLQRDLQFGYRDG